jgi:hypothetical protein
LPVAHAEHLLPEDHPALSRSSQAAIPSHNFED